MIRVKSIEIEEFRGIRSLTLNLEGENFGISGPNGTGKSGVVDALEFVLTGNVTRLGGAGSAEVTLKAHGPHVDSRNTPQKSRVMVVAFSPQLNKEFSIERNVSSPSSAKIAPDELDIRQAIEELSKHPELALSRREIVKYIITPAGQRSKDVQTLLRLDQIEEVRASFQSVANKRKKESTAADADDSRLRADFSNHLGIANLSKENILKVVNERRALLQADLLTVFNSETSLKQGIAASEKKGGESVVSKSAASKALKTFGAAITALGATEVSTGRTKALELLQEFKAKPELLRGFRQQVLVNQGLQLLEDDACPLCDEAWEVEMLRAHLEKKRDDAKDVKKKFEGLEKELDPLRLCGSELAVAAQSIGPIVKASKPKLEVPELRKFFELIKAAMKTVDAVVTDPSKLDEAIAALSGPAWKISDVAELELMSIANFVDQLPEPSKEEEAKEFLILAQEKCEKCREASVRKKRAASDAALAAKASELYGKSSVEVLEAIYDAVESDFTSFYRFINDDDEMEFVGELSVPSPQKLALNVDFYGRGKFPPGAYHSEGHQDGMGLCLYLALMKHTLAENFTFAVLDDVLMSVDAGHRRAVCRLLKDKFPSTQFVLTTHDPVWLAFMRTEQLVAKSVSFSGWTVDSGPQVWSEGDVWQQIEELLKKDDVPAAAAKLRRYMEYVATVLASNFRASVTFQENGLYDFGDLVPAAFAAFKDALTLAKKSATKWGKPIDSIESLYLEVKEKVARTKAEEWAINKAVHFNAWANMTKKEFAEVALSFREALDAMRCAEAKCKQYLRISPRKGIEEVFSCGCGATSFNLKLK